MEFAYSPRLRVPTEQAAALAAHAIARVAEAGAVGGSIEDYDPRGVICEDLPKTPTGKLLRRELRTSARDSRPSTVER